MNAMPAEVGSEEAITTAPRKRVVIVGAGFAGFATALALRQADADVVLIDRRDHHILQPLLWHVAEAVLAPKALAGESKSEQKKPGVGPGASAVETFFRRRSTRRVAIDFVIAVIASCLTTYVSRQPLTVPELLRMAHSASLFAAPAGATLLAFAAVCLAVLGARIAAIRNLMNRASPVGGPERVSPPTGVVDLTPSPSRKPRSPIFTVKEAVQ